MGEEEKEMSAKEYLESISQMDKKIRAEKNHLRILREVAATPSSTNLSGMPSAHNASDSAMLNTVCKITELEARIAADEAAFEERKVLLKDAVGEIPDEILQHAIIGHYFDNLSWISLARAEHCSDSYIYKHLNWAFDKMDAYMASKNRQFKTV